MQHVARTKKIYLLPFDLLIILLENDQAQTYSKKEKNGNKLKMSNN